MYAGNLRNLLSVKGELPTRGTTGQKCWPVSLETLEEKMRDNGFKQLTLMLNLGNCITLLAILFIIVSPITAVAGEQNDHEIKSRYLNEVNKNDYSEIAPPQNAPIFRWDFSKKKVMAYAFNQEVVANTVMPLDPGDDSGDSEQSMTIRGVLSVKSQGDGTATIVLSDLKTSMRISIDKSDAPKTMEQAGPAVVVPEVKEDGTGSFGDTSQDMMLKLLFSLPTKALKVGESVDVPAQLPFNAMGSQLQAKGRSRITLTRYVLVANHRCAQLDIDIDISDLKVPSELEGHYSCSAKGSAVFFFDINNRCFVSGSTALMMQFSIDAPMPKMNVQDERPQHFPDKMKMSMKSDNLIRVLLQE